MHSAQFLKQNSIFFNYEKESIKSFCNGNAVAGCIYWL